MKDKDIIRNSLLRKYSKNILIHHTTRLNWLDELNDVNLFALKYKIFYNGKEQPLMSNRSEKASN